MSSASFIIQHFADKVQGKSGAVPSALELERLPRCCGQAGASLARLKSHSVLVLCHDEGDMCVCLTIFNLFLSQNTSSTAVL